MHFINFFVYTAHIDVGQAEKLWSLLLPMASTLSVNVLPSVAWLGGYDF